MPAKAGPLTERRILEYQREEVTGYLIYSGMAARERNGANRRILRDIAAEEKEHAAVWKKYSGREVRPNRLRVLWYTVLEYILGYTFVIKLMERYETIFIAEYRTLLADVPELRDIVDQEEQHEDRLLGMLDEERLRYAGSMVLGLNDALVELTGTLAGLTFALADNRLVALAGIITGISATLSMAASNYLAERVNGSQTAFRSCLYTGAAYLVTVVCLVSPYLLFPDHMYIAAFGTMLAAVILIIFLFNYYISVAKDLPFMRRFGEMAAISLGVAVVSFIIGLVAKLVLDI